MQLAGFLHFDKMVGKLPLTYPLRKRRDVYMVVMVVMKVVMIVRRIAANIY